MTAAGISANLAPDVWKALIPLRRWMASKGFLDVAIDEGMSFKLISDPTKATDYYKDGLDYLTSLRYTYNHDMTTLVPPKTL